VYLLALVKPARRHSGRTLVGLVSDIGAEVTGRELDELFTAQEHGTRPAPWKTAKY